MSKKQIWIIDFQIILNTNRFRNTKFQTCQTQTNSLLAQALLIYTSKFLDDLGALITYDLSDFELFGFSY